MSDETLITVVFIALGVFLIVGVVFVMSGMTKLHKRGKLKVQRDWTSVLSILVSLLMTSSFFAFGFFIPTLQSFLRPNCRFLMNMQIAPLATLLLISIGGVLLSWFMARADKHMSTYNGFGTKMFSRSETSEGYISTKWLVALFIPLVPVRSYHVFQEWVRANRTTYEMVPLEEIAWDQVNETIQEKMWVYGIAVFVIIALISFSIWMCNKEGILNYA